MLKFLATSKRMATTVRKSQEDYLKEFDVLIDGSLHEQEFCKFNMKFFILKILNVAFPFLDFKIRIITRLNEIFDMT